MKAGHISRNLVNVGGFFLQTGRLDIRAGRYYRDTGISQYFISVIRIVIQLAVSRYFHVNL